MTLVERVELKPGYSISRILKGGWQLAGGHSEIDRDAAIGEMADYVKVGITTFDCADIYTGVEQMIGDFRRNAIAAGQAELLEPLKIHTKFVPDRDVLATMTKQDAEAIIDRSLARLGLERLDLVQFHWWNTDVRRYAEVATWLREFQNKGKIDLLGITNFNDTATREILAAGVPLVTTQVQYSLLDDRVEKALVQTTRDNGMKLLCYGTVAGGFLSDRWLGSAEPSEPLENRSLTKYKLIIDDIGGWDFFQALLQTYSHSRGPARCRHRRCRDALCPRSAPGCRDHRGRSPRRPSRGPRTGDVVASNRSGSQRDRCGTGGKARAGRRLLRSGTRCGRASWAHHEVQSQHGLACPRPASLFA